MQIRTFSNSLTYMDYDSWGLIWDTRGYLPKNKRTSETAENKHRATHKPLMNSEKLVYNSKEDCFEVYWGYNVNPHYHKDQEVLGAHPNLIFKCYRHFWKLYPGLGNDWLTRGKVARINKYCPLNNSWMHVSRGIVQVYGWGEIRDGFVLTKTRARVQAKHTVHGLRLGIQTALDYATKPGTARGIGSRSENSDAIPTHLPHYTRDQISKIVNYYVNQQIHEFCSKLVYRDGERTPHTGTSGFHNYPIFLQERGIAGFDPEIHSEDKLSYIVALNGRRSDFNTASFHLLNVFGLHITAHEEDDDSTYYKLTKVGPRYPYSRNFETYRRRGHYQADDNTDQGARNLLKHILSYCYYQSTVYDHSSRSGEMPLPGLSIPSSHVLLFLSVLFYCADTLHGFDITFERIFGKAALAALKEHDSESTHLEILTGDIRIESYDRDAVASFSSFWSYLFETGMLGAISESLWDKTDTTMTFSRLKDAIPEIRQAMLSFFEDIIKHGVNYNDVGFSPFSTIATNYPDSDCSEHAIGHDVARTPLMHDSVSLKAVPVSPSHLVCTGAARDSSQINVTALSKLDNLLAGSDCFEVLDHYCFDEERRKSK